VYIVYAPFSGAIPRFCGETELGIQRSARDLIDNQKERMKMNWYLMVLKKYAEFNGRARRTEYWMFQLFNILVCFAALILGLILMKASIALGIFIYVLLGIYGLGILLPGLAVSVRRLHDSDKSGWLILVCLVPFIGGLILLIMMFLDSTPGPNQFGPNPKQA
jgi:uncharacterized membrane protein YhaH (DUF805 family)